MLLSFFPRFRRAVRASLGTLGAREFRAGGELVVCPVCQGRDFVRSTGGGFQKPLLLGVNAPWRKLSRYTTALICAHCTHILTFARPPELVEEGEDPGR
jgi:hypothetical protein